MATVSLFQERINLGGGLGFRIMNHVESATDIPRELFLLYSADDSFAHVATLQDFVFPAEKTPGFDFYRSASTFRDFDDVETALDFANHVKTRITTLLKCYNDDFANFSGAETVILSS